MRGGGVFRGVGGVGALAAGAVEDAGAIGAVGGPDRLDLGAGAGLGHCRPASCNTSVPRRVRNGADDPVDPLGGGPAGRLVVVGGDHGGEGDLPVRGQRPGAVVADDADPALARWRRGLGDGQPGADMDGVRPGGCGGRGRGQGDA